MYLQVSIFLFFPSIGVPYKNLQEIIKIMTKQFNMDPTSLYIIGHRMEGNFAILVMVA